MTKFWLNHINSTLGCTIETSPEVSETARIYLLGRRRVRLRYGVGRTYIWDNGAFLVKTPYSWFFYWSDEKEHHNLDSCSFRRVGLGEFGHLTKISFSLDSEPSSVCVSLSSLSDPVLSFFFSSLYIVKGGVFINLVSINYGTDKISTKKVLL